ncbi:hypothetical protein N9W84_00790 [bacterium]|nr:hypothetical protein [bacterium]
MIKSLINLANKLDGLGFKKEADILDGVLKIASNFDDEVTEEEIKKTEEEMEEARSMGIESEPPVSKDDSKELMDAPLGDNPKMLFSLEGKTYIDDDGKVYAENADVYLISEDAVERLENAKDSDDVHRAINHPGLRVHSTSDRKEEILDLFKKL